MCKYCEEGKDIEYIGEEKEMDGRIAVDPDEKRLLVTITTWHKERSFDYYSPDEWIDKDTLLTFEANYCPICGKKLGE